MSSKRVFLDTNVIADFIEPSRPRNKTAVKLIEYLTTNSYQVFISEDMLSAIFYIAKDKKAVLNFLGVIQKKWDIVHFGKDTIKMAINTALDKNLDLEDALQCLCAKNNNCNILITNDKAFFDGTVKAYTTDEFLSLQNK